MLRDVKNTTMILNNSTQVFPSVWLMGANICRIFLNGVWGGPVPPQPLFLLRRSRTRRESPGWDGCPGVSAFKNKGSGTSLPPEGVWLLDKPPLSL